MLPWRSVALLQIPLEKPLHSLINVIHYGHGQRVAVRQTKGNEMHEHKTTVSFSVPAFFIELAVACKEQLPETINADVSVDFVGDDWEVSVDAIRAEDGTEIDRTWLDENAGYDLSLREQIKLNYIQNNLQS